MNQWVRSIQGGVIALAGVFAASSGWPAETDSLAWDYWLPRDELSQRELISLPEFCAGAYRWPLFPHSKALKAEDFPLEVEAQHAEYFNSGEVFLKGDVVVIQGNRTLRAPSAILNHKLREGHISDGVLVEDPDVIATGTDARMNLDTKATTLNNAEFLLLGPEFRGTAKQLVRDDAGNVRIASSTFTRCGPDSNNWRIGARSFEIKDGSDYGTARRAVIRIKNVPVFYTPYLSFPINEQRKSGWLFPQMSFTSQGGIEFAPPYYLNLAPNYDATVRPRYVQKRGLGIEAEFRHLSSREQTTLAGSFIGQDKSYDGTFEKDDFDRLSEAGLVSGPFEPADRWLYAMRHKGDFGYWRTTVDYTAVSDRDYFRNLGTELDVASRRELERSGQLQYSRGGFDMRFWAQRFDRLDSFPVEAYQRLPELTLNYSGFLPGPFEWSMGASGASYDRTNDELNGVNKIVGSRVHLEPRLRMPLSNSWGFLTLMGGYRYTAYDLSDTEPDVEAKPERKIGLGSADAGMFFERDMNFFGASVIQTLEPRVRYLYQQFQDQNDLPRFDVTKLTFRYDQLWRDNRFSGLDRISDADQLSVGLTSRFINAATGREYLRANLGQIRYFKDRRVTKSGTQQSRDLTNDSELAGELVGQIGRWRIGGNIIWEPNEKRTDEGGAFARFRSDNDHILYLGYRFRKSTDVDQTDISFTWPLTGRYSLIGRWNFDLNTRRIVEGLAGIEYNDCCWKIRFIARTYLDTPSARLFAEADTRQAVYLQIVFKGLAGIGNSVEPLLAKSIPGYAMEN